MPLNWGVVVSGAMKMNYPKMLYKGNKVNYEYSTANDAEHEDALKDQGFVDYADLGDEPEPVLDQFPDIGRIQTGGNIDPDVMGLKIENNKLLEQLYEREDEIARLNQIIVAGSQENFELRSQLNGQTLTQDELIVFKNDISAMKARIAELQGDTTPVGATKESVNYADMTSDELRALLDEKGIKYLARASKLELISLLG